MTFTITTAADARTDARTGARGTGRAGLLTAALEHGVLTYGHASRRYGESHLRSQLAADRWQAPTPTVVVLHNGPLTTPQHLWVALLAAPPGTVLGGLSAAERDGLVGFPAERTHLVVPGSSRDLRSSRNVIGEEWGVVLRWSTKLGVEGVRRSVTPPRTRMARSLIDAASERVPERRARVLVLAGVQQRLTRPPLLWDSLSRRGRCRNRAIIAESILDATGGIESLPELEFDAICRRRGLPAPTRQRVLRRRDGRYYLDAEWERYGVRAEIHGIPHSQVENWDQDLLRQNDISIDGDGLLVFSSYAIRHLQQRIASQLERMLRSRGCTG